MGHFTGRETGKGGKRKERKGKGRMGQRIRGKREGEGEMG